MKKYKTGVYPIFDDKYTQLKNESPILSSNNNQISAHDVLYDRRNLEGVRLELIGDKNGQYRKYDDLKTAAIPYVKSQLAELDEKWEIYREERENQGYSLPSEEDMPVDQLNKKLILEARLNIYEEELSKINEKLKSYKDFEDQQSAELVLKYGLMQSGSLQGGVLHEIDGQLCGMINDVLCIKDKRSPYDSMSVADYRKLAVQWRESEILRDQEELKLINAEQTRRGLPISDQYSSWNRVVKPEELPPFPENFERHIVETETITRTK